MRSKCWPRRLWSKIAGKPILYLIFFKHLHIPAETSCKFFFYFTHNIKNWGFDIHFNDTTSKVQPQVPLSPFPFRWVLLQFQTPEEERSPKVLWSSVWHSTSQHSGQFPMPGSPEWGGQWVFSWVPFLSLSQWTDGATPFWENSQNRSALLHT